MKQTHTGRNQMNTPKGFFRCIGINCPACPPAMLGLTPHGWGPSFHPLASAPASWGLMFQTGEVFLIEPEPAMVA